MARRGDPVSHDPVEFGSGHAAVRGGDQGHQTLFAQGGKGLQIALDSGLEGLLVGPFRMIGRHRPDAVQREIGLGIKRRFGPKRAVVVEGGDPFGDRAEIRAALCGGGRDKADDRRLGRAVVP